MKLGGLVRHARLLTEKMTEQVKARKGKNLKYLAGVQIRIAKGLITDSEMASFLSAIDGALSKFEGEAPCEVEIEGSPVSDDQIEMEQAINDQMKRANQLELDMATAAKNPPPKLVEG